MPINKKINFNSGEFVKLAIGRSLWAWFWQVLLASIFIIVPFFAMYPLFNLGAIGVAIYMILIFIGLIIALRIYVCKSNTLFIMTNLRIIDLDQSGFFYKSAIEIPYQNVKSVKQVRSGFLNFLLGLGNIDIFLSDNVSKIRLFKVRQSKKFIEEIYLISRKYRNT